MRSDHRKMKSGIPIPIVFSLLCGMLLLSMDGSSQEYKIKGRVVDSDGKRVPGVNILIKGTPDGAVANAEGYFNVSVPFGESTLLFSFIGYKPIEQRIIQDKEYVYELKVTLVKDKLPFRKEKSSVDIIKHSAKTIL